ncbi:MAG: succinate dehydrogenase cytochrome b subunit [Muribaculaceae bacterium]|nr:succinate dehydrogenase cytochrome b subunit [Muribaculaceae bacterium]
MWLKSSSIGRKLLMSITGACLVLFVTFHVLMNSVAILWPAAYNSVCAFLGANWYALVACAGLALLFVVHILYAFILTLQNRKARGNNRYAVTSTPKSVEWSSKNMLVLGIVVVAFMVVHFIQFWYKMQWQEIIGNHFYTTAEGAAIPVTAGSLFIQFAFQSWWTPVVYIIGFVALWFHMNHGFWSMFQSAGWNNNTWLPRLKKISCVWTTLVIGLFIVQAGWFTYQANQGEYLYNTELKGQYKAIVLEHFHEKAQEIQMNAKGQFDPEAMQKMQELQAEFQKTAQSLDSLCTKPVAPVVVPAEEIVNNNETAANDSVAIDNQEQSANN